MWALIKAVLVKFAVLKAVLKLLKGLGSLGIFIPIALLLSTFGWPMLLIIGVLAVPILILLFVLGLPLLLVFGGGGVMLTVIGFVLTTAMPIIKLVLFVVVPLFLMLWMAKFLWRVMFGGPDTRGDVAAPPPPPPVDPTTATGEAGA